MVLLYFMDGVKFDMMQQYMPYLASLNTMPLKSEFGYSCACHATMYTGRPIEEHGTWFIWKKGDNSPYRWVDKVPGLKYINFLPLKFLISKITRRLCGNSSYSGVSCLVNLPLKYWSMFEPCDDVMWDDPRWKSDIPNMFTILKAKKIPHSIIALHRNTKADDAFREEKSADYEEDEFIYFFLGYTDNMMHSFGESAESAAYLAEVDGFIEKTAAKAKAARPGEDITVIAFSDHGHIGLEKPYIDINDYFRAEGLNVNDYIQLIESNYARFWFRNDRERREVEAVIKRLTDAKLGYVIGEELKAKYRLNINEKEHGELIFYLDAPHEFTNTIWGFGHTTVSGHGFDPENPKHLGIFCSNKALMPGHSFARLADILPTVLYEAHIPSEEYHLPGERLLTD